MEGTKTVAVQGNDKAASADDTLAHSEDEFDRLLDESLRKVDEGALEEWQVLTHIFKAFVGTGILGLPSAVMHGGIVLGPTVLVLLGLVCMYNIKLLVDTAKHLRQSLGINIISYSGISEHLLSVYGTKAGTFGKYMTDFLLCSLQLGFCCVYVVFIAHNIQVVAGMLDVRIWMVVLFPFLVIPSLITNISRLAYLTTIGNVIVLIGLGVIYHYLVTNLEDPKLFPTTNGYLNACVSFGQVVYAFEGIAVVLPTENKLKKRESFDFVLKVAASIVLILYVSMGVLGYLTFGEDTLGSITLNLPQTALYQTLQIFFAVMVYFTYPLQLLVSVEIIKCYIQTHKQTESEKHTYELLLRSFLVVSTCILAICIPQLDNFMALVGSISGVAVGLILPPIFHTLCYWRQGLSRLQFALNIFITLIGIFAFITGTLATIYSIMHRFIHEPSSTKLLVQS
ncbi:proton-coupled amino acid transporter 1-like [Hydractinia symbiolongicarpus]|uniref:proton-coupled amino acid transporter 1-like n=1 Tax=Hydractinia symbiolongicarpus TaxID=13093 RepID=UPI00254F5F0F|nr:proton-coupled amino acid transporter 1-like [Hydractinia symbiolongicarpus]XP_057315671.1 proton-coupled amino acid transporter 1-like [Hydractinia symbiolongicarpus]XP_057315672.1 proton-coupled amino acid transporter 1-like [Hydractinia symbiolongicarpus]